MRLSPELTSDGYQFDGKTLSDKYVECIPQIIENIFFLFLNLQKAFLLFLQFFVDLGKLLLEIAVLRLEKGVRLRELGNFIWKEKIVHAV